MLHGHFGNFSFVHATDRTSLSSQLADLLLDAGLLLGVGELLGAVLLALGLPLLLGLLGALVLILLERVLADGLVGLKVDVLEVTGINLIVDVLAELTLVALLVVVGKSLHVLGNVATGDVLAEGLGIKLLGFNVVTGESALGVRDEQATVRSTLEGTEDTGTGRGADETNVQEDLEGTTGTVVSLGGLGQGVFTVGLLNTFKGFVKLELLEQTAGEEQTGGVGSRPVGQTVLDSIALQLVGVGGSDDLVTGDLGVDDLGDDVAVGEADLDAGLLLPFHKTEFVLLLLTTRRYFLDEYLFLAWVIRRLRA
jgi:hypothetical protein